MEKENITEIEKIKQDILGGLDLQISNLQYKMNILNTYKKKIKKVNNPAQLSIIKKELLEDNILNSFIFIRQTLEKFK